MSIDENPNNEKLNEFKKRTQLGIAWSSSHQFEQISIKSRDGLNLFARLFLNGDNKKIMLFFHGYRSAAEQDFGGAVDFYYSLGYTIVFADQRSCGKSEGKYTTYGIKERYDCLEWVNYLTARFKNDAQIILCGVSMGASTVLMASSLKLPQTVKGIIADCGYSSPKEIIETVAKKSIKIPTPLIWFFLSPMAHIFGGFGFDEASPEREVSKTKLPILFVHGKSDTFVPTYMSEKNYNSCKSKKILLLTEDADHVQSYLKNESDYKKNVIEFLKYTKG
ncbi:MAG: alpha/beta hydrolase [Clostridia bacterium]